MSDHDATLLAQRIRDLFPKTTPRVEFFRAGYYRVTIDAVRSRQGRFVLVVEARDAVNAMHLVVDTCPAEFLSD